MSIDGEIHTIEVADRVIVGALGGIHRDFLASATQSASIQLDLDGVVECDVAFVQLAEALRRDVAARGGRVRLRMPAAGQVLSVLERGGFLDDPDRHAFWLCEETGP